MTLDDVIREFDGARRGAAMHAFAAALYPLCRSITGSGIRETLRMIKGTIPLSLHEVPTGTQVFDWTVPREWNIRDAYVVDPTGKKIIDFKASNLHVVNYSIPVRQSLPLSELRAHLFTLPEHPALIPYKTSYYKENWGFCLADRQLEELRDGMYEVVIDSTLTEGNLSYGEYEIRGSSDDEVLISCHACHPSLCNDNLSGIVLAAELASMLRGLSLRYTYRFLFIPGAIGSITWLARNRERVSRIKHGLVVACVGDRGKMTYKKSRQGKAEIDRAVLHVLRHKGEEFAVKEFSPYGYDERQYCSPGFNLPVGSLTRTPHGEFPEYHTSADNLEFITPDALADSLATYLSVVQVLESNRAYRNLNPYCEPQLGRRGLYRTMGGRSDEPLQELAMLWVLNLSDGGHSLLDISERAELPFGVVARAAHTLRDHQLLEETSISHERKQSFRE